MVSQFKENEKVFSKTNENMDDLIQNDLLEMATRSTNEYEDQKQIQQRLKKGDNKHHHDRGTSAICDSKGHLLTKQYEYYYNKIKSLSSASSRRGAKTRPRSRSFDRRGAMSLKRRSFDERINEEYGTLTSTLSNNKNTSNLDYSETRRHCLYRAEEPNESGKQRTSLSETSPYLNQIIQDNNGIKMSPPSLISESNQSCVLIAKEMQLNSKIEEDNKKSYSTFKNEFKQRLLRSGGGAMRSVITTIPIHHQKKYNNKQEETRTPTYHRKIVSHPQKEQTSDVDRISQMRKEFQNQRHHATASSEADICNQKFKDEFKQQFLLNGSRRLISVSDPNLFAKSKAYNTSSSSLFIDQIRHEFHIQQHKNNGHAKICDKNNVHTNKSCRRGALLFPGTMY